MMSKSKHANANIGAEGDKQSTSLSVNASAVPLPPAVRRLRARRALVVESSPETEEASGAGRSAPELHPLLGDPIEDSDEDDEQQVIMDTQIEIMDAVRADDPQVDWRTQDPGILVEDDLVSDPDDITEPESYQVPHKIRQIESAALDKAASPQNHSIHERYTTFLRRLCGLTDTLEAEAHAKKGLPHVIRHARSMNLDQDLRERLDMDLYAHAVVIYVWLVVCLRIQQGSSPPDRSLTSEMGSFFLSSHAIVEGDCTTTNGELVFALQHWEQRIKTMTRGNLWLREQWFIDIPNPDPTVPVSRNKIADGYMQALLQEGRCGLLLTILAVDRESDQRTPLRTFTEKGVQCSRWVLPELAEILVSMDIEVLKALIDGSLTRKFEIPSSEVSKALQRMENQKPAPPSIYQNSICDGMGMSPTPAQWRNVCDHMLIYVAGGEESDQLAEVVDQLIYPSKRWTPRLAEMGLRRYTEWRSYIEQDGDRTPSTRHRRMVKFFAGQMEERIRAERQAGRCHVPFMAPVIEIGFSINHVGRLREHRQHRNSNYLMNLAEALFKHLYPGSFQLQQVVIYTCFRPAQCWFSEVILTQLGQGYTEGAGGFSHYTAGYSNSGPYRKTSKEDWATFLYEATRSGDLIREMKRFAAEASSMESAVQQRAIIKAEDTKRTIDFYKAFNDVLDAEIALAQSLLGAQ